MPKTENEKKVKKPVCYGSSCFHYSMNLDSDGKFAGGCMWNKNGSCGNYEPRYEREYIGDPYEYFDD